jgi:hypothetical protein
VAATGIFKIGYDLLDSLLGGDDGTSPVVSHSATQPATMPPTSTPEPTKTSTSTTSSSTCTYTETATPVIVVTKKGTTSLEFQALVDSLPLDKDSDTLTGSWLSNWAYMGSMDRCTAEKLWDNPIVEAMSLNRIAAIFDSNDVDPNTLDLNAPITKRSIVTTTSSDSDIARLNRRKATNGTDSLSARTLAASKHYVTQPGGGEHLRWLSGQSRQRTNMGKFYDFEDYLYDDRAMNAPLVFPPRIYVVDTYFLSTHDDFSSRVMAKIAVNGAFGDVENPHGTCMTSIAAGTWTGVYKKADIALVQAKFNQRDDAIALWNTIQAYSEIMRNVQELGLEGNAVISQSFGESAHTPAPHSTSLTPLPGVPVRFLWFDVVDDQGRNVDALGVYLNALFDLGVAATASAGNWANRPDLAEFAKLEAQTPRRNGGTNSPLVVVGNADQSGNRYESSNHVDTNNAGILTLYAPGTNILCAVKDNTDAWNIEPPGTSQATALTAGLMAYFLSDPVLHAQFVDGGVQNMPMRLKQYLIDVSTANKGIGGWGDPNTDNVPRISNGENVECSTDVQQGAPPVPAFVMPPQSATGKQFASTEISQGLTVVLPQSLRVSLISFHFPGIWDVRLLTWTSSLGVTTACKSGTYQRVVHSNQIRRGVNLLSVLVPTGLCRKHLSRAGIPSYHPYGVAEIHRPLSLAEPKSPSPWNLHSKESNRIGWRRDQARVIEGYRRQEEAVFARLLGVLPESLQIPQLADRHAKLVEEPRVQN